MNTTTQAYKNTLTHARILQREYTALGVKSTQNVRNPIPMIELVAAALPTLPLPTDSVDAIQTITATINGRIVKKSIKVKVPVSQLLSNDFWKTYGHTTDDVTDDIRSAGYIAKKQTVAMTLNQLRHRGLVASVRCTRKLKRGNKKVKVSFCRYFALPANP